MARSPCADATVGQLAERLQGGELNRGRLAGVEQSRQDVESSIDRRPGPAAGSPRRGPPAGPSDSGKLARLGRRRGRAARPAPFAPALASDPPERRRPRPSPSITARIRAGLGFGTGEPVEQRLDSAGSFSAPTRTASSSSQARPSGRLEEAGRALARASMRSPGPAAKRAEDGGTGPAVAGSLHGDRRQSGSIALGSRQDAQRERRLEPDHRVGIVGQREQVLGQRRAVAEPRFSELGGLLANAGLGSSQAGEQVSSVEGPQNVERPEGMHRPSGVGSRVGRDAFRSGIAAGSLRSIRSRWAVSRHQASGSARWFDELRGLWPARAPAGGRRVSLLGHEVVEPALGPCRWSGRGAS